MSHLYHISIEPQCFIDLLTESNKHLYRQFTIFYCKPDRKNAHLMTPGKAQTENSGSQTIFINKLKCY